MHARAAKVPSRAFVHRALLLLLVPIGLVIAWAGLRPLADYSDAWVGFDAASGSTRFGKYGLAHGALPEAVSRATLGPDFRMEFTVAFRPASDGRFQVIAQLDAPGDEAVLIVGLWRTTLIAMNGRDFANEAGLPRASADLEDRVGRRVRFSVAFGPEDTRIDADGRPVAHGPPFRFGAPLRRITIGNSPDGAHGWDGALESFDLFADADAALPAASYAFDAASPERIDDRTDASPALAVPPPGRFPDRARMSRMGLRQLFGQNLGDVIVNFLGFAPLGFAVVGALRTRGRPLGRFASVLIATGIGTLATAAIETAQLHIPGRSPHVHDLVLNAVGTLAGATAFLALAAAARRVGAARGTTGHEASAGTGH